MESEKLVKVVSEERKELSSIPHEMRDMSSNQARPLLLKSMSQVSVK